jgi:hypothetical protein
MVSDGETRSKFLAGLLVVPVKVLGWSVGKSADIISLTGRVEVRRSEVGMEIAEKSP